MEKAHLKMFLRCLIAILLCSSCECKRYEPVSQEYNPNGPTQRLGGTPTGKVTEDEISNLPYEFLRRMLRKALNKEKADFNYTDADNNPALRWAAQFEPKFAKLLIDAGADVNQKGQGGITPLHEAALHGNEDVVKLLLNNNADPSLKADNGNTPLDTLSSFTKDEAKKKRVEAMLKAKIS